MQTQLESNLEAVRTRIAEAARSANRDPGAVELLAVTKTVPPPVAARLVALGQHALGENRADELERKSAWFAEHGVEARWHFIGHLQRNKARRVVRAATVIHSIDSRELLDTVERVAGEEGRRPELYLQIELAHDGAKEGLPRAELDALVARARSLEHAEVVGLMAMAPLETPRDDGRPPGAVRAFGELAELARCMEADAEARAVFRGGRVRLSMGMSGDLEAAVDAGADLVRIGSALFEGIDLAELAR